MRRDFLPKRLVWKGKVGESSWTVQELNKPDLSQVTKVSINSDNHIGSVLPLIWCGESDTLSSFFPKSVTLV